jgi:Uma2 family endonuclease
MSAAPKFPSDMGYAGLRMTAEEFFALGETPDRYELIDGVVVMSPSPTMRHQVILHLIQEQAGAWRRANPGVRVTPGVDIRFGNRLVYCPDLAIYKKGRVTGLPDRPEVAPDLVIELLSPGSKAIDLITKRKDYERHGVREYWVIDPADASARVWRLKGKKFIEANAGRDKLRAASLRGFVLDLRPLRNPEQA